MSDLTLSPAQHIAAARKWLVRLAGLAGQTEAAERSILAAAVARRMAIQTDLDKLRGRAVTDGDLGDRYRALVLERGQVDTVIARAKQALGR